MREANSQRFFLDGEWGEEGGGVSVGSRRFSPKKRRSENRGATIGGKTIDRTARDPMVASSFSSDRLAPDRNFAERNNP